MTDSIKIDFIKDFLEKEYTGHTDKECTVFIKRYYHEADEQRRKKMDVQLTINRDRELMELEARTAQTAKQDG